MAPKELEKVLYFAASVITWVDEEARSKDLAKLEKEVEKQAGEYEREREQRTQELNEALVRRLAYLGVAAEKDAEAPPAGTTDGFNDDDELWADTRHQREADEGRGSRQDGQGAHARPSTPRSRTPRPTSTRRPSGSARSSRSSRR